MNAITHNDVREMAAPQTERCVSIYLPTDKSGVDELRDRVVLKTLLDEAEERLGQEGVPPGLAQKWLQEPRALLEIKALRAGRSRGLALFISGSMFRQFHTPEPVPAQVVVGRRFYLKPLLAFVGSDQAFWLLTLSQDHVRFFAGSRYDLHEVAVPDKPANLATALNEQLVDRGEQVHSGARVGTGKEAAVFHGQGGAADTHKDGIVRYFRQIDAALKPALRDQTAPLILAAVDSHIPLYRSANSYSHMLEESVAGNADHLNTPELHARAWSVVKPRLQVQIEGCRRKYQRSLAHGQAASDLRKILFEIYAGRVETLFVDQEAQQWGSFDPASLTTTLHENWMQGDDDLLDVAAVETLLHGGKVFVVPQEQLPEPASLGAVYRY